MKNKRKIQKALRETEWMIAYWSKRYKEATRDLEVAMKEFDNVRNLHNKLLKHLKEL